MIFYIATLLDPKTLVRIVLPKIKFDLNISRPIFVYKNKLSLASDKPQEVWAYPENLIKIRGGLEGKGG